MREQLLCPRAQANERLMDERSGAGRDSRGSEGGDEREDGRKDLVNQEY